MTPALLSTRQAAAMLGVHVDTLRAWRRQGTGPRWIRAGAKLVRYSVADVNAWAREHNYLSTAEEAAGSAGGAA